MQYLSFKLVKVRHELNHLNSKFGNYIIVFKFQLIRDKFLYSFTLPKKLFKKSFLIWFKKENDISFTFSVDYLFSNDKEFYSQRELLKCSFNG